MLDNQIFSSRNVMEMQRVGMAMLADVQDFQYTCQKITSVFYKQCFSLDNHKLQDTIAEAITSILFTALGGVVHYLVRALFTA